MNLATPFNLKALLITGAICTVIGGIAGGWVQDLRFTAKLAVKDAQHSGEMKAISDQAQRDTVAALNRMKAAQDALAELDRQKTEELANAKAESDRLRADVAAGTRRVRLAKADLATCQLTAGRNSAAGGVGDAVQVELSPEGGRAVLDLRDSAVKDNAVIEYLQGYIRKVVKQCKR